MDSLPDGYEAVDFIGGGTYGQVYKCRDKETGQVVAIKVTTVENELEGVPTSIIREVSYLKEMDHNNIVKLLNVHNSGKHVYLVFEYLDLNLWGFISGQVGVLDSVIVKKFLKQILRAVAYCHFNKILHRDLKPDNLLIDCRTNVVKLADFGLARAFGIPSESYTRQVATPAYRAPELLLGSRQYSTAVDMWSVGCIFAEMLTKKPLFSSGTEVEQIVSIFRLLGTPNEETWPGVTSLCASVSEFKKYEPKDLAVKFPMLESDGVNLISQMLCLDPNKRITAEGALKHRYFSNVERERLRCPASSQPSCSFISTDIAT